MVWVKILKHLMSIFLLDINGLIVHVSVAGDLFFIPYAFEMIICKEFCKVVDNLVKITITKKPYKLSNKLLVYKRGVKCNVSMFKLKVVIEDLVPKEIGKECFFQVGDEFPVHSQQSLKKEEFIENNTNIVPKSWWKHAWTMITSPL
eukprot:NODE_377_length_9768_cov_0.153584.p5 type:complete len:147 gc:universal NODE_377_length_9768_cov_0.153584:5039-5479(+)